MRITGEDGDLLRNIAVLWDRIGTVKPLVAEVTGAMGYKSVNGTEYLVRYWNDHQTGRKRFQSLGRRSEDTDHRLRAFMSEKTRLTSSLKDLERTLTRNCRLARACELLRVPAEVGAFLRELAARPSAFESVAIGGAYAVPAYEIRAGRRCDVPARRRKEPIRLTAFVEHVEELRYAEAFASMIGIEASQANLNEDETGIRIEALDGRSVAVLLRGAFEFGDRPDVMAIAVAKDGAPAPIRAVDPSLWIEAEEMVGVTGADPDVRHQFVRDHVVPALDPNSVVVQWGLSPSGP